MSDCHGLLAAFDSEEALLAAARASRRRGYSRIEAFSPYPVEGLEEAVGFRQIAIPLGVFLGGVLGAGAGYLLQYWCSTIDYPINVGGRPLNSWPSFLPVTFEMTVLVASLTAFTLFMVLNGLPRLHHPLFAVPQFQPAEHTFYLLIESHDPRFSKQEAQAFLRSLRPLDVYEVPNV